MSYYASKLRGVTARRRSIPTSNLLLLPIMLPSQEIQAKMVRILNAVVESTTKRKRQLEQLDLLVKSRFIEMFGDPVENPMGWESGAFRDAATEVKYGTSRASLRFTAVGAHTYE
jgi:type I restriction enzyme S subunit